MTNFGYGLLTFPTITMGLTPPPISNTSFSFWRKYSKKVETPDAGSFAWFECQLHPHKLTDLDRLPQL